MYDRNVKSERILTKLRVLDYEYICDRIAKFHKKILFITRVINIQILTTNYFSFQYSVTYCSHAFRRPAHRARETVHLLTHNSLSLQLCGQPTVLTLTQSTTRFGGSCRIVCTVYRSQIRDVDQQVSPDRRVGTSTSISIDKALRQWRPRLRACVRLRAHGGHFEHRL